MFRAQGGRTTGGSNSPSSFFMGKLGRGLMCPEDELALAP